MAVLERKGKNIKRPPDSFIYNLGSLGANYGSSMLGGLGIETPKYELTQDWANTVSPFTEGFGKLQGK